ncbi:MAG: ABC transporter ATP-binding protein [Eubacteriales bacterium]|nr:ABC transporter ATP-binding protein [Eubacteriales bacterium]
MSLILQDFATGYRTWQTNQISFTVPTHHLAALLGPNGSGKSTILKGAVGLIKNSGHITIDDLTITDMDSRRRTQKIAYLPQRHQFTFPIAVEDVMLMGFNPEMPVFEQYSSAQRHMVRDMLERLGLVSSGLTDINQLSEGQKQRVMLGQILIRKTKVLMLDEPDSALDFSVRQDILHLIRSFVRTETRCGLIVLHDPALALKYCDQIHLMFEGRIIDTIYPKAESATSIEQKLRKVYPQITLFRTPNADLAIDWQVSEDDHR